VTLHRPAVSWRKTLLLNRAALLRAWAAHFPAHDFSTLRPFQPSAKLLPPPGWSEYWREAAREYHEERRRKCET
jgi:hypothetical protein